MSGVLTVSVGTDSKSLATRFRCAGLFTSHLVGSVVGGLALGLVLAPVRLLSENIDFVRLFLGAVGVLSILSFATRRHEDAWPQRRGQVPVGWMVRGPIGVTFFGWGLYLGIGVLTYAVTPLFFGLLAVISLQPSLQDSLIVSAAYGAARASSILVLRNYEERSRICYPSDHRKLRRLLGTPALVSVALALVLGSVFDSF